MGARKVAFRTMGAHKGHTFYVKSKCWQSIPFSSHIKTPGKIKNLWRNEELEEKL